MRSMFPVCDGWNASLVLSGCLAAGAVVGGAGLVASAAQEAGQVAYTEAGCARCHALEVRDLVPTVSERMQGPDLGSVGTDHDAAWIVGVVKRDVEVGGRRHPAPYRGTDDQLATLADWLVGLGQR